MTYFTYDSFHIPQHWIEIANVIKRSSGKDTFIAGGCLRDLELNVGITDVDIFVDHGVMEGEKATDAPTVWHEISKELSNRYKSYTIEKNLKHGYGGFYTAKFIIEETEYNLIFHAAATHLEGLLDQFDLGICQIGFDGVHVKYSINYARDAAAKTITILKPTSWKESQELNHLTRVAKKYPDYRIV